MLFLSDEDVRAVLPMGDCIGAVERVFKEYAMGNVVMPTRSSVDVVGRGIMLSMPSLVADSALAVKIVTVFPENLYKILPD